MSPQKIIAVVAATGNQGSSVAKTFLATPGWHVRCLTRDPHSPKASHLASMGAEVVQADLGDPASLSRAFQGVHAIFINTDFWGPYMAALGAPSLGEAWKTSSADALDVARSRGFDIEVLHGRNAADAAAAVPTLERLVYSALPSMKAASGGKYPHCLHWEGKAAVVDYILGSDAQPLRSLASKTSLIYLGAYSTNAFLLPKPSADSPGQYSLMVPCGRDTRLPIVDPARSTGPFVRALVEHEEPGMKLFAYDRASDLTVGEAMDVWCRVTGKRSTFVEVTEEEMRVLTGLPYEVLDGPAHIGEFGYMAGVTGIVEPGQLKVPVETCSYEESLRERPLEELL
ncbi:hypothetical protein RB595_008728 [Gaeumannomyces hyphopodioides]